MHQVTPTLFRNSAGDDVANTTKSVYYCIKLYDEYNAIGFEMNYWK
jgi:hypothetical protein